MGGLQEGGRGSAGARPPAAVWAARVGFAERRPGPCCAPAREQRRVRVSGRTASRGCENGGG